MSHRHTDYIETLQKTPPGAPAMMDKMTVALRRRMYACFLQMLEGEGACRRDKSIEALRSMRQAVNELALLVEIVEKVYDQKTVKKGRKRLRQLGERLDAVYGLDMMMRDILHYGAGLAQRMTIASIVAHLDAQRLLAKNSLLDFMDSKKYSKFLRRFQTFLTEPVEDALDADPELDPGNPERVRELLPVLLHKQLATVRAYGPFIASEDSEIFTEMRDDVWRFRYTVSCFEDVLGSSAKAYMRDLSQLEALLNRVYETSETLHRLIHLPRLNMDNEQLIALKNYRKDLRARRAKLYEEIPELWEDFNMRRTQENLSQSILVLL